MPGSARSNSQRMYNDEYYYSIFGSEAKAGVIADLLKISYYYDKFVKTNRIDQAIYESEKELEEGAVSIDLNEAFEKLNRKYYG